MDAFLQSINNLGLKQHLLVAEVETMERALKLGNAYFQADSTCRPGTATQQVGADDDMSTSPAKAAVHVAMAAAEEPTNLTTSLVREPLPEIRQQSPAVASSRQSRDPEGRRQMSAIGGAPYYAGAVVVAGTSYKVAPIAGGGS